MKLGEIAAKIHEHLKRFEADPVINARKGNGLTPYYNASSVTSGRYVAVTYVSFQYTHRLTKQQALSYLAWLDAGNVGRYKGEL